MRRDTPSLFRSLTRCLSIVASLPLALTVNAETPNLIVGIGTHYAQFDGVPDQDFPVIRQLGFTHIRDEVYWRNIEREPGKLEMPAEYEAFVRSAEKNGVGVLLALNYGNKHYDKGSYPTSEEGIEAFCKYAEFVVKQFKGRVKYYELWNEWDLGIGVPKRADGKRDAGAIEPYVALAKAVYPRLKKIDPSITLLAGASAEPGTFGGWLERGVKLGLLDACDGISFHPYNRPAPPEDCIQKIEALIPRLRAASGNPAKPLKLYITELGWPTEVGSNRSVSPQRQGAFLARMLLLTATVPELQGIWWFNFQHAGVGQLHGDGESTYGIVYPDLTLTPAAAAAQDVAPLMKGLEFVERLDTKSDSLIALRFKRTGGKDVIAAWSTAADDNWQLRMQTTRTERGEVTVQTVGGKAITRTWGERRREKPADGSAAKTVLDPSMLMITVRDMPVLIEGDLGDISAVSVRRNEFPELLRGVRGYPNVPDQIAIALPSFKDAKPLPLAYEAILKNIDRNDADSSANCTVSYTENAVEVSVVVNDDTHAPDLSGDPANSWKGDSLQVAIMDLEPAGEGKEADRASGKYTGLVLSLDTAGKVRSHREAGSVAADAFGATVSRDGRTTTYLLKIPATIYGRKAWQAGDKLALSLVVNDSDGPAGREAILIWGGGIAKGKDPTKFNWIILQP